MLADVACDGGNLVCYATGKQGITLLTTTGGTSWTQQAGGGSQANQLNGISCTSTSTCYAAGAAGTILKTTNGGQTWLPATSGTTTALNAISCFQANGCTAVGAVASGAAVVRTTGDGTNWNAAGNTGTQALNGVSCLPGGGCLAVGAAGTAISSTSGGSTWSPSPTRHGERAERGVLSVVERLLRGRRRRHDPEVPEHRQRPLAADERHDHGAERRRVPTTRLHRRREQPRSSARRTAARASPRRATRSAAARRRRTRRASRSTVRTAPPSRCLVGAGAQGDILMTVVAPTTSATVSPASPNGLNGWYVTAPTVTLTATAARQAGRVDDVLDRRRPEPDLHRPVPGLDGRVARDLVLLDRHGRQHRDGAPDHGQGRPARPDLVRADHAGDPERLVRLADGDADRQRRLGLAGSTRSATRSTAATWHDLHRPALRLHDRQPLRPVPRDRRRRPGRGDDEPDRVQGGREEADRERLGADRRPRTTSRTRS